VTILNVESSADLTLDLMSRVGVDGESVRLGERALQGIRRRRREFVEFVEANSDRHLYGITTRHHTGAKSILDPASRAEYAARLPTTPATVGESLPQRVLRMIVLARLADVLNGTACLRPETAQRLVSMLDQELPPVPVRGNGEPGDIIALGHLFRERFEGSLELGEGMALINGSPVAVAALCDVSLVGRERILRSLDAFALASVAADVPVEHYSCWLDVAWNDPHQTATLAAFRERLEGVDSETRRAYQAPVSFRSAPRVVGWAIRCQQQVEDACSVVLPASSNNPIYVGPESEPPLGAVISNGGYHNAVVTPSIDALSHAWADLCQLATAQVNQLVEDPAGLVSGEPEPQVSVFYMASAGWAEEARAAATHTLISTAAGGQTDTGTPDLLAWRKAQEVGQALDANLTLLTIAAAHTIAHKGRAVPPGLVKLHDQVMEKFPLGSAPIDFRRQLSDVAESLNNLSRTQPLKAS
jgi:histidine ammonia-lyase